MLMKDIKLTRTLRLFKNNEEKKRNITMSMPLVLHRSTGSSLISGSISVSPAYNLVDDLNPPHFVPIFEEIEHGFPRKRTLHFVESTELGTGIVESSESVKEFSIVVE